MILVSVVDLFPTILDVLNYEIPEGLCGESLLNIKSGKSRNVFSESFPDGKIFEWNQQRFDRIEWAIFSGQYKFVSSTIGKRELYDLSKDPNEKKDLYKVNDGVSRELEKKLNQWFKTVPSAESTLPTKIKKDALENLKALGYIQ